MADIRDGVVSGPGVPPVAAAVARDKYGLDVANAFGPLLNDANAYVRLNAAMAIAQIETISADAALRDMLKHASPEIRYWGARGLTAISPTSMKVGGALKANIIDALEKAGNAETSGVVQQEILRALIAYEDLKGVMICLEKMVALMPGTISDRGVLDALSLGLQYVDKVIKAAPDADKKQAAGIAAQIASFTAQQQGAFVEMQDSIKQPVPPAYTTSAMNAIKWATNVMSSAAGKTFRTKTNVSPAEVLFDVNSTVGSDGGPGELQKSIPGIAVPPKIKTGA